MFLHIQCSTTCQTGHQMRMVVCTSVGVVVSDDQCDQNLRPISERSCNGHIDCFRKLANFAWTFILSTIFCCITILHDTVTTLCCDTEFCCLACKDEYPRHCHQQLVKGQTWWLATLSLSCTVASYNARCYG